MHSKCLLLVVTLTSGVLHLTEAVCIPDNILFGVGSASYQIEGAWNYGDKSESIWDDLTHNYPELVSAEANGDVAADSFNKINEDVAQLQSIGVHFYQFSLSWSRLLPEGYSNNVSAVGLQYYNDLIDALVAADIIPMVVLYHWDLPTILQKLGGWTNPELIDIYTDYARVAFENFGDRVKYWITFSSPSEVCKAYGADNRAPAGVSSSQTGIGEYLCANTILKAHARTYHLYNDTYRPDQNGTIGIALFANWYEPDTISSVDIIAAIRALHFEIGLYANPIFTSAGDYPTMVKDTIRRRSAAEGFPYSRLPELTAQEIEYIKFTSDFFGVNHYTTYMAADRQMYSSDPEYFLDLEVTYWQPQLDWEDTAVDWVKVVPWGFRRLLVWLQREYNYGPTFYITENGYPDYGEVDDDLRISYIQRQVSALQDAIADGVSVGAYTYWNFLDGFEWLEGYNVTYGMVSVNMTDPNRSRTLKSSARYYRDLIRSRSVEPDQNCNFTSVPTTPPPTDNPDESTTSAPPSGLASTFAMPHNLGVMLSISTVTMVLFSLIRS
ncbi:myrosinase 1-like [Agrilus planipennis]|uniref:Myrosinase 1-like n=1 Tax=Agrilus planipennis TaxID=224129 RepID=A0A1W4W9W9_AGRPL|nr:myrosinase 1-like [Agrilus planipennis]